MRRSHGTIGVLVLTGAVMACSERAATPEEAFDVVLPEPQVLVPLESELIGQPVGIDVDPSGHLWVADSRGRSVLAFDPAGRLLRRVGREGKGPGELQAPTGIAVTDTLIRVVDSGNMRVQEYRPDGTHVADHVIESSMLGAAVITSDGRLIVPTMGYDSALAIVTSAGNGAAVRLGTPVVDPPAGFDFAAIKAVIADGRVPDEFRNQVTAVQGGGGITWLVVQTEAEIRKFARDGTLLWASTLAVPEVEVARGEFIRRNREETNPARIHSFMPVRAAREVGGDLWVLLAGEENGPAAVYVVDGETGSHRGRMLVEVPAASNSFAVDRERMVLYLSIPSEASILAVDISGVEDLIRTER